jgi:hypothetical protein
MMLTVSDTKAPFTPQAEHKYPSGVPDKFDRDGNVQYFPGNTIIIHLDHESEIYKALTATYNRLSKPNSLSHLYTLLPPPSFHMTVFEGCTDKIRKPGYWPADMALDAPLEQCTSAFKSKLSSFHLGTPLPYKLTIAGYKALGNGVSLHVIPQPAFETVLRNLRDELSENLQIKAPKHDKYRFHISLAYFVEFLSEEQKVEMTELLMEDFDSIPKEFELGSPEFCTYESMFRFDPVLVLTNGTL